MNLDAIEVKSIHESEGELNESKEGLITSRKSNIGGI